MNQLLIIPCSQRKTDYPEPQPAIQRYDGPLYQMLRKLMSEGNWPNSLHLLILSARYGLIYPEHAIKPYDVKMTPQIATDLQPTVRQRLEARLYFIDYTDILINLGQTYQIALETTTALHQHPSVTFLQGRIGERMSATKAWILAIQSEPHTI